MKIQPKGNRVLVRVQAAETKTAGGIIIPDLAQKSKNRGVVVAVGDGAPCAPDDVVVFTPGAGQKVQLDKGEALIIDGGDILATIED
jgi:chaperonin GroES